MFSKTSTSALIVDGDNTSDDEENFAIENFAIDYNQNNWSKIQPQQNNESSDDMSIVEFETETTKYPRKKPDKSISKMQKMDKAKKPKEKSKSNDKDLQMRRKSEQEKIATKLILIENEYHCKEATCKFKCSVKSKYTAWAHARKDDCSTQGKQRRHKQVIHECTEMNCEETFTSKVKLTMHYRRDHMLARHICHICEEQFKSRQSMVQHMKIYHIEENQNVCDECGKACKSAGLLKKHKEEKHSGESEEDIRKKFETLCGEDPKFEQWKSLVEAAAKLRSTLGIKLLL